MALKDNKPGKKAPPSRWNKPDSNEEVEVEVVPNEANSRRKSCVYISYHIHRLTLVQTSSHFQPDARQ